MVREAVVSACGISLAVIVAGFLFPVAAAGAGYSERGYANQCHARHRTWGGGAELLQSREILAGGHRLRSGLAAGHRAGGAGVVPP
jgi:hypothetical protein